MVNHDAFGQALLRNVPDFLKDLFRVEPFVPRVSALSDEGIRDLCACNIVEDLKRFVFLSSCILLLRRTYVGDLVAATDFSVLTALSYLPKSWLRRILSLNMWKKMIL